MKYSVGSEEQYRDVKSKVSAVPRLVIEHYFERGFDKLRYHCPLSGRVPRVYMNVRTFKTELGPGSWIIDFHVWPVKLI